jgi:hypothetical protein
MRNLILIAIVVAAAAWPQAADAQDQPCPEGTPPAIEARGPGFIAWGRSAQVRVEASANEGAILSASEPVSVVTSAQAPRNYGALEVAVGVTPTVQMPQRTSTLRVGVTWLQHLDLNFRGECRLQVLVTIRGGVGKLPSGVRLSTSGGPVARIAVGSPGGSCNELARVPLTFEVASRGQKPARVRSPDVCSTSRLGVDNGAWSLRQDGRQRFLFRAGKAGRPGREVFTYRARAGSRLVGAGRFVVIRSSSGRISINRLSGR